MGYSIIGGILAVVFIGWFLWKITFGWFVWGDNPRYRHKPYKHGDHDHYSSDAWLRCALEQDAERKAAKRAARVKESAEDYRALAGSRTIKVRGPFREIHHKDGTITFEGVTDE